MNNIFNHWITTSNSKPFYARKKFNIDKEINKAIVSVCGLGQFNLYLNGNKVGDHLLDPAWSDYNKLIYYVDFDLKDILLKGTNTIGVEVGNGWYIMDDSDNNYSFHFPSFMPPNPNGYKPFNSQLILGVHLTIEYIDGSIEIIDSDDTWLTHKHMIKVSNVYGSETIDGRLKIKDWASNKCIEDDWDKAIIVSKENEPKVELRLQVMPVKTIKRYSANKINNINNRIIYDFNQNVSGMLSFKVKGHKGDIIKVYPAEKLKDNGDVDQVAKNWLDINVCETYIIGQDDIFEEFKMTFTYFGGRYIALEGCKQENIKDIYLDAISSATIKAGSFECDDDRLMKIYDLVEKSVEANMVSVHTDCPTIERFAWQEENHLMVPSIMYMKSVKEHFEKFFEDTRISQHYKADYFRDMNGNKYYPGDGLIPSQAPCFIPNVLPVPGMGDFYDIIGWGSSIIIGTNWHYIFYGDQAIIERNYEAAKRYINHLKTKINKDGFINHGLGDWGNPNELYARENIETAFLYADLTIMSKWANLLNKQDDEIYFNRFANEVLDNYNSKLLVKNNDKYCYKMFDHKELTMSPAIEAMPLYFGMVPKDKESDVVETLKELVSEKNSFETGEVGQPYIIQTLSKYGMHDLILKVILSPTHPSYYAFVLANETTLGEYWEDNPRSHNHDMMGHIIEYYYNGIAGIKPLKPGFKEVLIDPHMPDTCNYIKCTYNSINGLISVELIRLEDNRIDVKVKADKNIKIIYKN